ncbi:MAG: EAL domain-containing protein [Actinobacteria bacterium]|nr:MAG: EAL domain-containing protein [Actinomycetota bacterium]
MKAAPIARISWSLVVFGLVLAASNSVIGSVRLSNALYLVSTVQVVVVLIFSVIYVKPDKALWPSLLVLALSSAIAQVFDGSFTQRPQLQAIPEALFLLVQIILASGLLFIITQRLGSDPLSVLADGLVVALGAWFFIWTVLLQPTIGMTDQTLLVSILRGSTLAMSTVVLFALATLLFGDSTRTLSVWFVAGAITCTLIGDFLYAANDSGRIHIPSTHSSSAYIVSLFLASAAFCHPSISLLTERGPTLPQRPLLGRLIITTAALILPVVVLALTNPVNETDRWVQAVSIFVLTGAVTSRVIHAVRSNATTQRSLISSAQTDALTGLPNRSLMLTHVSNSLISAATQGRLPTVLFIDVDRFKNINDSLGHQAGDAVLVAVAQRLRNALPHRCAVGRISGDEFVVLDPDTRSPSDAIQLADRILESFHEPLTLRQGDVFVSASIGVATFHPSITSHADDLLRHADTAMYRAKDAGRNCVAVFDESMLERVTQRLAIETALYRALERREIKLVHQPIVDIDMGDVVGFEALMRWQRDDGTMISPAEFIPIAEETGTIIPLGAWALLEALTHLRDWISQGACRSDATMSVNVSPRQLHDPNFVAVVNEALLRAHVPPEQLWLEVTESVMISQPEQALDALNALCDLGVRIAIDDFGTGYSSLSLLQKFPIQRLKIDKSFVNSVANDDSARSLVRTIIAMGESLQLDMVAEGVETVDQLQTLADLGCAKAQGFLISHPVPPESIGSVVAQLDSFGAWNKLRGRSN